MGMGERRSLEEKGVELKSLGHSDEEEINLGRSKALPRLKSEQEVGRIGPLDSVSEEKAKEARGTDLDESLKIKASTDDGEWKIAVDKGSGRKYRYNKKTKKTEWLKSG